MITLSSQAIVKIIELLTNEEPNTRLRIFVQGGCCSGFTYGFVFDTELNDDDFEIKFKSESGSDYSFLVDSMSQQYLNDATVDYSEDIMGSSFKINNPQATSTCGCGSSFSV